MQENKYSKVIEDLFILQDLNKRTKLSVITENQLRQVEKIEEEIENKLKELYVPGED